MAATDMYYTGQPIQLDYERFLFICLNSFFFLFRYLIPLYSIFFSIKLITKKLICIFFFRYQQFKCYINVM